VWVRSAAIRPIPVYAQVSRSALESVEQWLDSDEQATEARLNELFERFEHEQPVLAKRIGGQLARAGDEVALALGYFLSLVIWLAFDNSFSSDLGRITDTDVTSVDEALTLDEELRGADPAEAVDSDDVVAMEQPYVLGFVHEHIDAALEVHAAEVDVAAVHTIYRLILIEVLALSYAVAPIGDIAITTSEIHA
jgi:hypothetical protein